MILPVRGRHIALKGLIKSATFSRLLPEIVRNIKKRNAIF